MVVWHGPDGIQVEVIVLDQRPCYRITQTAGGRRYLLAYARRVAEVARHVDLADLTEVIPMRARRAG